MLLWLGGEILIKKRNGVWRGMVDDGNTDSKFNWIGKIGRLMMLTVIGIILALIVWKMGEVFGGMRLVFAGTVGVVPLVLLWFDHS